MQKLILLIRLLALAVCFLSAAFTSAEIIYRKPGGAAGCLFEAMFGQIIPRPELIAIESGMILLFGILFWVATRPPNLFRLSASAVSLMIAQTVLATLFSIELLLLVAIEAALILPLRFAIPWVMVQSALQVGSVYAQVRITGSHPLLNLFESRPGHVWVAMLLMAITSQVWHFLSLGLGLLAAGAVRQAMELNRVIAELRATQQVEAATARLAERLNISRELHDSSGHHLAALSVNLRLMRHISRSDEMSEKIEESLLVTGQLLADVRGVVRDLRNVSTIDLKKAIETMAAGMPGIQVHFSMADGTVAAAPFQVHALFRCAQEVLTNTVKHSNARNLWLEITETPPNIRLFARDDGRGASQIVFGNGLQGIEERVSEMGGSLQVHSRVGEGFSLSLTLPVRARSA